MKCDECLCDLHECLLLDCNDCRKWGDNRMGTIFNSFFSLNCLLIVPPPSTNPTATPNPLANPKVQARLGSSFLRWGGSSRSGPRQHRGHRSQKVFCDFRQTRERTERRIRHSWSEGALPKFRELLTKTTNPTILWERSGSRWTSSSFFRCYSLFVFSCCTPL